MTFWISVRVFGCPCKMYAYMYEKLLHVDDIVNIMFKYTVVLHKNEETGILSDPQMQSINQDTFDYLTSTYAGVMPNSFSRDCTVADRFLKS